MSGNEYSPVWSPGDPLEPGDELISEEEAEELGFDTDGWVMADGIPVQVIPDEG